MSSLHATGNSTPLSGSRSGRENDDMETERSQVSERAVQDGTSTLQLRLYQREMLEESMQKNIIVAVWRRNLAKR